MSKTTNRKRPSHTELRKLLQLGPKEIVPDLTLFANAEDESSGDATEVFVFKKVSGKLGIVRIPREQACFDPKAVARMIVAKNGILPRDRDKAEKVASAASRVEPREYWLQVKADGWRPDFSAFVHRGRVIGRNRIGRLRLKASSSNSQRSYILSRRGDLQTWRRMLRLASFSSRMRLGLCAAFGAPLLKVIDLQSFMLVIAGPSKAGKSTVLLALASVIGIGQEGGLPNFNATGASLQEVAAEFNDSVLPVNEIGLLKGTKRDAYQSLRPLIYRYAEGRDTGRHSKSAFASASGIASWRGIMVASSENAVEALAELAGEKRDEGEYARAFDVPAVRPGNSTVFDRFPHHVAPEHHEAWARQQLAEIRRLCGENHGLALQRYVAFLIQHRATLKADIERAMGEFLSSLKGAERSGALQHAARNFALLYAGAVMAKRAGLLPWDLSATRKALKTCFLDGLREVARVEGTEERARKAITSHLHVLGPAASVTDLNAVDGWFKNTKRGRIFAVRTTCFRDWLSSPEEERAALRWLHRMQLLQPKDGAKAEWPNVEWAVTWPKIGKTGTRCYQFLDPRQGDA